MVHIITLHMIIFRNVTLQTSTGEKIFFIQHIMCPPNGNTYLCMIRSSSQRTTMSRRILVYEKVIQICIACLLFQVCTSFSLIFQKKYRFGIIKSPLYPAKSGFSSNRDSNNEQQQEKQQQVYILSFDGVIADTLEWRAYSAIQVALDIWPSLQQHLNHNNDSQWLVNKMKALLPDTLSSGPEGMSGIDAVLLVRLLLEEQLLDGGKSNGCRGKYGGKYHPSSTLQEVENENNHDFAEEEEEDNESSTSSRPLTVGEISANWNQGALIKDTLRVKYHVNYQDPIPIIENAMLMYSQRNTTSQTETKQITHMVTPKTNDLILDAILDSQQHASIVILAGHETHIPFIQTILEEKMMNVYNSSRNTTSSSTSSSSTSRNTNTLTPTNAIMTTFHTVTTIEPNAITILSPTKEYNQHSKIIEVILSNLEDSTVHVLHSDITTLRNMKPFLLHVPRNTLGGVGGLTFSPCAVGKNVQLKLSLPSWPTTTNNMASTATSWQAQNEAQMDAWLDTCNDFMDFVDVLSSRVMPQ